MRLMTPFVIKNAAIFISDYERYIVDAEEKLAEMTKIEYPPGISIYKSRVADLEAAICQLKEYL